jgi:hypothetical protein
MRNRLIQSVMVLPLILIPVSALVAQTPGAYRPKAGASIPAHDPHDLQGVWLGGGSGVRAVSNDFPPMTAWGKAKYDANKPSFGPKAVHPALGNDPLGDTNPPGLVRALVYDRPIEIIQLPDRVLQLFEWTHFWRVIWTDGRKLPDIDVAEPLWYGTSIGHWEGDTFVVESVGLDERSWLDQMGRPHSDEMKLTEHWRRVDRDNLELVFTIDDPKAYTKPWVSDKKTLNLQARPSPYSELREVIFAPADEQRFNNEVRNPAAGLPATTPKK